MRLRNGNSLDPSLLETPVEKSTAAKPNSSFSSPSSAVSHQRPSQQWKYRNWVLSGLGAVVLIWLGYWYWESQWIMTTGRMMFQQAHITSPLTGRVASIHVREGEEVTRGQLLVKLEDWAMQSELEKAQSAVEQAQARLQLFANIGIDPSFTIRLQKGKENYTHATYQLKEVRADLGKVMAQQGHMAQVFDRAKRLYLLRALTVAEWEQASVDFETIQNDVHAVKVRLEMADAARDGALALWEQEKVAYEHAKKKTKTDLAALRLEVEKAKAHLQGVKSRLGQLQITAPQAGVVSWLPRVIGEVIDHNDTVVGLMDPSEMWVEAYVEGDVLAEIYPRQEAWVKVAGVSDDYFKGTVAMVYPSQRKAEERFHVGPDKARSPAHLSQVTHPVKVTLRDPLPFEVRQEMIVWVWFNRP